MYEHGEFESFHTCDMALHDMTDMKAQAPKKSNFDVHRMGGNVGWRTRWKKTRQIADSVGSICDSLVFGSREPAVLDPIDSEAITRQLTSELNLPMYNSLVDFVRDLVRDSQEPARLAARADGQLASSTGTTSLRVGQATATEVKRQARQPRLLDIWTDRLLEELRLMDAPVMRKLESCLDRMADPGDDCQEVRQLYYSQWRQWLQEAKSVSVPGTEADLIDHLMVRREEPCGRTVPEVLRPRSLKFQDPSKDTSWTKVSSPSGGSLPGLSL